MNPSLGVFAIFSNALPGSLLLGLMFYVTWRLGVLDPSDGLSEYSVILLVLGFGASILTGHLLHSVSKSET